MFKSKDETKIVVSMKSSAVELSVVSLDKIPKILFVQKEKLLFKDSMNSQEFIDYSINGLKKILKENLINIKKLLSKDFSCEFVLHSPWFLPEIVSEKNKTNKISLKKFFLERAKPPQQEDYKQIENKITNILLNGYHLTKLRDIESKDIEINIFRSFVANETADLLAKVIKNDFPNVQKINFSSSIMQIYETIKSIFVDDDNAIFLNIGGEVTEIGVVIKDVLTSVMTIPMGTHMFARELDTFVSNKNNFGALKFLGDKTSDEKIDKTKNDKIQILTESWFTEILDSINENSTSFPPKLFLFSDSESIDFFKMILKNNKISSKFKFFAINQSVFEGRVILDKIPNLNVEYLLSAYYLSIKS